MIPASLEAFAGGYVIDAEYVHTAGEPLDPVALGVMEVGTECVQVYRREEILRWTELPFPCDPAHFVVSYNAPAESAFLHALGVGMPAMWIDLMAESRTLRNIAIAKRYMKPFQQAHPEIYRPNQDITLLESVDIFGVEGGGDADFKEVSRELVMSRQWESGDEGIWQQICAYCESDVRLTARLLMKVEPHIGNLQEALIRGRYAAEQGRMTARGIPVDRHMLQRLKVEHLQILQRYREEVDPDGIRLTPKGRISQSWLARKLTALGIKPQHPHTRTGKASTKAADLTETAGEFGDEELRRIAQWAQLVKIFSEGKDGELKFSAMGADGRVRYSQLPFLTNTGRSGAFEETALMSLPKWMRGLVQPLPGEVLLCADFSAEEFAVAAGLSRDVQMQQAYAAGDPYVNMALAAGLEEDQARQARSMYKSLVLGKMFGMGLQRFRERSGVSYAQAVQAWRFFDREFARFREWQKRTAMLARQRGWIKTRYGWMARVYPATRDTSLMNWIIQSSAGDVLRLTVLLLAEAGIDVLMTMHDAVLVSCPESQAAEVSAAVVRIMREAAEIAVGLAIRVELQEVRPGERLLSKDTLPEWQRVMDLLESVA